jgi:hypothetical protein
MSFGLPLKGEGDEKCLSILNSVEETISRQLRACKAQALSTKKTVQGLCIFGQITRSCLWASSSWILCFPIAEMSCCQILLS